MFGKRIVQKLMGTLLLGLIAVSGSLYGQNVPSQSAASKWEVSSDTSATAASSASSGSQIHLGPGDLLDVRVFDVPEMNQMVRVSRFGDATFSLIGSVHVANLTPEEARHVIAQRLTEGSFLVNPQVSVLIQEYGTQGVSVLGEVQKPGTYQVLGNQTLLEIISVAGGTTAYAGASVTIQRSADGTLLTIPLTKDASATLASDVRLQPGDKVMIPRASMVYVIGDVGRPGGFLMQNGGRVTVLQAMALAGGQTRTASLNHARLIHKTASGYMETQVRLKKMMNGHEHDTELQAEDILYIPNNDTKSVLFRTLPSILQSATNAAIYGAIY